MAATLEQYFRLRTACGVALLAQTLAAGGLIVGGAVNQSHAMLTAGLLAGSGVVIWATLLLFYGQHVAERREDLEAEELQRQRLGTGIFAGEDVSLRLARKRLTNMTKYLLPVMTLVLAAYYLSAAVLCWTVLQKPTADGEPLAPTNPLTMAGLCGFGVAFVLFVISRYAGGLAKLSYAGLLRAGSSNMFLTSLSALACCVVLVLADAKLPRPEAITALVIPWVLAVLGAEAILGFVLDLYRPRQPGAALRAGFESRLANLLAEPTGIAGSIAQSLNYQFGFEISKTWFYLLIQRSLVLLIAFQVVTLLSLTCLVVIPADAVGILETFGNPVGLSRDAEGRLTSAGVLGPGLHFKGPWPVQTVRPVNVGQVRSLSLGLSSGTFSPEDEKKAQNIKVILWSEEVHGVSPELDLLVARSAEGGETGTSRTGILPVQPNKAGILPVPASGPSASPVQGQNPNGTGVPPVPPKGTDKMSVLQKSVPVSIVRTRVELLYRVTDPVAFSYHYSDPEKVLQAVAEGELTRYLAGTSLQQVLGADRDAAARLLRERINTACRTGILPVPSDKAAVLPDTSSSPGVSPGSNKKTSGTGETPVLQNALPQTLGIEVFYVGFLDIHPPKDLVTDFESVISAQQDAQATIKQARSTANRILAEVAGTRESADEVFGLINRYTQSQSRGWSDELTQLSRQIETLLATVGGKAASTLSGAKAERWETVMTQRAKAEGYAAALGAYRAAPDVFRMDQVHAVLAKELGERKKVFQAFDSDVVKLWVDLQDPPAAGLIAPLER